MTAAPTEETIIGDLVRTFEQLKITAKVVGCLIKWPLCRFTVVLDGATQLKVLEKFSKEIAMSMKAISEPLILPGRTNGMLDGTVRLDLMMAAHPEVPFDGLAMSAAFASKEVLEKYHVPLLLGTTDVDEPLIVDLQQMPHLIVAGVTGSGKSMMLHSIIKSAEVHAEEVGIRLALVDPKLVEFGCYERNKKLLRYSVATSTEEAVEILDDLHATMEERLEKLAAAGCRDILEYRATGKKMPFIILIVDELADLMRDTKSGFAKNLCALASKSRAVGIHCIVATQHPSREIITGLLKAQFPTRILCKVATQAHSRVGIDRNGAEKLTGLGDALLLDNSGDLKRFKGALVKIQGFLDPPKKSVVSKPKPTSWFDRLLGK